MMGLRKLQMIFSIHIQQTKQNVYRADCPSLPGCSVFGPSVDKAQQKMGEAIIWYLAGLNVAPPEELELQVTDNTQNIYRVWKTTGE